MIKFRTDTSSYHKERNFVRQNLFCKLETVDFCEQKKVNNGLNKQQP